MKRLWKAGFRPVLYIEYLSSVQFSVLWRAIHNESSTTYIGLDVAGNEVTETVVASRVYATHFQQWLNGKERRRYG